MKNMEYANAYSEVLEILKYISKEDYDKIPKNRINMFKASSNKNYKFHYNPELTLDEQKVSKRAKAIIAILFRDYWATQEQKIKIVKKQNYDLEKIENEKREKYKTDNLFKSNKNMEKTVQDLEQKEIVQYKKSLFARIKEKLQKLLKR